MMMRKQKSKATKHTGDGFSVVQLLITVTILMIISAFGVMGIIRAKASIRLSGAAREYASYVEKARVLSIRNHADNAGERATITINDDKTSYNLLMDLDNDGDMDTRTISLPSGVTFDTVETIAFDWRGRTWNTVGAITTSNAQVSIRLKNSSGSISVDVTGSGDVTVDSKVFDDSVPNVSLNVADLISGATPTPTPVSVATPTPTPSTQPTPDVSIAPTPTPTPTPSPTPTPTPVPCTVNADPILLILSLEGSATVKISHSSSTSVTVTGTSSKPSEIQVSPNSQTVAAGGSATFTVKSKKNSGVYSATFSTSCGSKTVPITVLPL